MAKKINRPAAVATLGVAALAGGLAAWRWSAPRPPAALPARPALSGQAALADHLAAAEKRVATEPARGREDLGRLYHANGFLAEAEACWRWLRIAEPRSGEWPYLLADVRSQAGDPTEVEVLLRETVEKAPDYSPAWLKLADLLFKSGRVDEAVSAYQRRLLLVPGDPYARLGHARASRQRARDDEAAVILAALVEEHPAFPPAHNLHAEVLAARGDAAGARRHRWLGREAGRYREPDDPWLRQLVTRCYDPKRLTTHATAAHQLGNHAEARSLMERAVELAPDDPGGYELLGELLLKQSDPGAARRWLEKGLEIARRHAGAVSPGLHLHLAEATRLTGDPSRSLAVLEDALRRDDAPELYLAKGVMLDALQRLPEAEAAFREAIKRAPNDSGAHYNLAIVLLQRERREEASGHLRHALIQQPTHAKALMVLGQLEIEAGRLDRAGEYLRPLFEANPGIPQVRELFSYWNLHAGLQAVEQGERAVAEKHYRDGIEAQAGVADLHISLAGLLLSDGRPAEALEPLDAYRRLRPAEAQGAYFTARALAQLGRRDEARQAAAEAEQLALRAGNAEMAARSRELLSRGP
ncbi:MAG TPA: tetratricopeptide repeat protein [Opitutaceae bacterium]|nr:tetratricopeptide repeat protein [Opitutaceae bacterium]